MPITPIAKAEGSGSAWIKLTLSGNPADVPNARELRI
jgi:hypothetical protein